ncbi:integrase [Pseudomonas chlororaphis]|nr:integrase [Pseudomonas chlororaphis]KAB0532033.1 integrase [Pseudomonas chlororaphis subsp. aureofaciens]TSD32892.1 integrase [Pseudomonas sp. ATCC 13985]
MAQQLGHSVQMLLSTYARWLDSGDDRGEMETLQHAPGMAQEPTRCSQPLDR